LRSSILLVWQCKIGGVADLAVGKCLMLKFEVFDTPRSLKLALSVEISDL
jgi:hypothetical protein